MSNVWLNIRFLCWHLQGEYGHLRLKIVHNDFWPWRKWLRHPMQFYEFSPREGWRRRNTNEHFAQKGE